MKRLVAFIGLWLAVTAAIVFTPGCYGRNCEISFAAYGVDAGQGVMIDENTWATTPLNAPWVPFPRQRYYFFDLSALGGRSPEIVIPYLSGSPDPMNRGDDFTMAAGNLVKMKHASPNHIEVWNDTCSDFFLRLVIRTAPLAPPSDEPVAAEAGVSVPDDAGTDASPADAADAD